MRFLEGELNEPDETAKPQVKTKISQYERNRVFITRYVVMLCYNIVTLSSILHFVPFNAFLRVRRVRGFVNVSRGEMAY
jgi:hypothetical protein